MAVETHRKQYEAAQALKLTALEENVTLAKGLREDHVLRKEAEARHEAAKKIWSEFEDPKNPGKFEGKYWENGRTDSRNSKSPMLLSTLFSLSVAAAATALVPIWGVILIGVAAAGVAYGFRRVFFDWRDEIRKDGFLAFLKNKLLVNVLRIGTVVAALAIGGLLPGLIALAVGTMLYHFFSKKKPEWLTEKWSKTAFWGVLVLVSAASFFIMSLLLPLSIIPAFLAGSAVLAGMIGVLTFVTAPVFSALSMFAAAVPVGLPMMMANMMGLSTTIVGWFGWGAALGVAAPYILPVLLGISILYTAWKAVQALRSDAAANADPEKMKVAIDEAIRAESVAVAGPGSRPGLAHPGAAAVDRGEGVEMELMGRSAAEAKAAAPPRLSPEVPNVPHVGASPAPSAPPAGFDPSETVDFKRTGSGVGGAAPSPRPLPYAPLPPNVDAKSAASASVGADSEGGLPSIRPQSDASRIAPADQRQPGGILKKGGEGRSSYNDIDGELREQPRGVRLDSKAHARNENDEDESVIANRDSYHGPGKGAFRTVPRASASSNMPAAFVAASSASSKPDPDPDSDPSRTVITRQPS